MVEIPAEALGLDCPLQEPPEDRQHDPMVRVEGVRGPDGEPLRLFVECPCHGIRSETYKIRHPDEMERPTQTAEQIHELGGVEEFLYSVEGMLQYGYGGDTIELLVNGTPMDIEFGEAMVTYP